MCCPDPGSPGRDGDQQLRKRLPSVRSRSTQGGGRRRGGFACTITVKRRRLFFFIDTVVIAAGPHCGRLGLFPRLPFSIVLPRSRHCRCRRSRLRFALL
ncbi:unnamed protein product [Ixodes pacificus]